jgi:uncharacterized protein YjeT (DUF2065 family)
MARESLDEFDDVVSDAGDSLVASLVLLISGIFAFIISTVVIRMISDIGRLPADASMILLSAAIIAGSVVLASVRLHS